MESTSEIPLPVSYKAKDNSLPTLNSTWPPIKVYEADFIPELKTMSVVVTELDLWDWFRTENPPNETGYSWWGHPNINLISSKLSPNPHSGATFAYCMRCMQSIAKSGFNTWSNEMKNK